MKKGTELFAGLGVIAIVGLLIQFAFYGGLIVLAIWAISKFIL